MHFPLANQPVFVLVLSRKVLSQNNKTNAFIINFSKPTDFSEITVARLKWCMKWKFFVWPLCIRIIVTISCNQCSAQLFFVMQRSYNMTNLLRKIPKGNSKGFFKYCFYLLHFCIYLVGQVKSPWNEILLSIE